MEFEIFSEELEIKAKQIEIELTKEQIEKYYNYMNLLLEWNEKIKMKEKNMILQRQELLHL